MNYAAFRQTFGAPKPGTGVDLAELGLNDVRFLKEFAETVGAGIFSDGLLSIASVREKGINLDEWESVIPAGARLFGSTAFGDLLLVTPEGTVVNVLTQTGEVIDFDAEGGRFLAEALPQVPARENLLREPLFKEWSIGIADPTQILAFTPALALGGTETTDSLNESSFQIYLSIQAQLLLPSDEAHGT